MGHGNIWRWSDGAGQIAVAMTAGAVMFGLLVGCSARLAGQQVIEGEWHRQQQRLDVDANTYAGGEATSHATTQPAIDVDEANTLRAYLMLALRRNPDILRAEQAARAKAEQIAQVTAMPDPMVMAKYLPEPIRTAEGDNPFILGVSQKIPAPGKLGRAGDVAMQELRMAIAAWQDTRLRIVGEVKRTHFRLYVIDQTAAVTRESMEVLRSLIDAARGQVASGRRSQGDVLRAQVELARLESRLLNLGQQRTTACAALNALTDRAPTTAVAPSAPFDVRQIDTSVDAMLRLAAEHSPALQQLGEQVERDRRAVALAKMASWPDVTLGAEWMLMESRRAFQPPVNPQTGQQPPYSTMSEDGSDNWAISISFNVPIWVDRIQAGVRQAQRQLAASQYALANAHNRVEMEAQDALARVESQRAVAALFGSTIIPQARQAYDVALGGYVGGATGFAELIDNWQVWLTATIEYHRAMGELERAIADLEQAIGLSISEIGASS